MPRSLTSRDLEALAEKYAVLDRLRNARDRGATRPAAKDLRDLSVQFPGCLRELDTLGGPEIRRRQQAASGAARGAPVEPWMIWIHAFHRLMGATLRVKAASAPKRRPADPHASDAAPGESQNDQGIVAARALREILSDLAHPDPPLFLVTIAAPPRGRLVPLVLGALAAAFHVDRNLLEETLFPSRRKPPRSLD